MHWRVFPCNACVLSEGSLVQLIFLSIGGEHYEDGGTIADIGRSYLVAVVAVHYVDGDGAEVSSLVIITCLACYYLR